METKQSGHAPRSGPEVKNGSGAKDGASKRLRLTALVSLSEFVDNLVSFQKIRSVLLYFFTTCYSKERAK